MRYLINVIINVTTRGHQIGAKTAFPYDWYALHLGDFSINCPFYHETTFSLQI